MKAILLPLFAAFAAASLTSCEVIVNDDGSKSVIVDPAQVSKALGSKAGVGEVGDVVRYENGKIIATK